MQPLGEGTTGPGLITIEVNHSITQHADRADLTVVVSGSSLISGNAALRQAREVADLVQALRSVGLEEGDIELLGVQAEQGASGGRLGRTSARYDLRVRCRDLSALPDVIGAVTAQRNTTLEATGWGYPDADAARDEAITEAVTVLRRRAAVVAESLGVRLLGVHAVRVHTPDAADGAMPMMRSMARAKAPESIELGVEVSHTRTLSVFVSGELRVTESFDG